MDDDLLAALRRKVDGGESLSHVERIALRHANAQALAALGGIAQAARGAKP